MTSENRKQPTTAPEVRQPKQRPEERPHCVLREADLFAGMDDMGRYASTDVPRARPHLAEVTA